MATWLHVLQVRVLTSHFQMFLLALCLTGCFYKPRGGPPWGIFHQKLDEIGEHSWSILPCRINTSGSHTPPLHPLHVTLFSSGGTLKLSTVHQNAPISTSGNYLCFLTTNSQASLVTEVLCGNPSFLSCQDVIPDNLAEKINQATGDFSFKGLHS